MTLYRVECSLHDFSACTRNEVEARKLKIFHQSWNADIARGDPHHVRVTATFDHARHENPNLLAVLA